MLKSLAPRQILGAGRPRRRARLGSLDPLADDALREYDEVDGSSVDTLIHELGGDEVRRLAERHPPLQPTGDDDVDADQAAVADRGARTHTRVPEPQTRQQEMSDAWMLRGGKAPLLTPAQEVVLAKRVEHGDLGAREELMNANVRLVASVARRYLGRGLPLEDLMQEGIIGLLRATEKYNYRKGYRFSTYATFWIRQAITRALANQGRSIRLPAHVVDAIGRIARTREELFQRLGRTPTRPEVAEAAGLTERKLIQLLKSATEPVSLEAPVGAEGESRFGDFLPAGHESSPTARVFRYLVRDERERALNTLTPREKEVIVLRYGLEDEDPHTLEETGRRLHITRERARQIEAKALEKLRHAQTAGRLSEALA